MSLVDDEFTDGGISWLANTAFNQEKMYFVEPVVFFVILFIGKISIFRTDSRRHLFDKYLI